jgi:predicted small secreted protein
MKTKLVSVILLLTLISGCSTLAGTVKGVGEDVKIGTDSLSKIIKSN